MRKRLVVGNWKMNTNYEEALELITEVNAMLTDELRNDAVEVVVAPPFTHLHSVKQLITHKQVQVAAQNCHSEGKGAFTGEVSAQMVKSIGCKYVIVGHSERRQYFAETDTLIAEKIKLALANELNVIYCCGETLQERESGHFFKILEQQFTTALSGLTAADMQHIIIAYEPVWAIGTGKTASAEQAQEVHAFIRNLLTNKWTREVSDATRILYGGSCNAKNAATLFAQPDIDGGLIGGASLKSRDFVEIVKAA